MTSLGDDHTPDTGGSDVTVRQDLVDRQIAYKRQRQAEASWTQKSKIKSAANLSFWIAGLTTVNLLAAVAGWSYEFPVGLLSPLLLMGFWSAAFGEGLAATVLSILSTLVLAAPFVVFGIYGRRCKIWPFVGAAAVYALDTAMLLLAPHPAWLILHALFLIWIVMALIEIRSAARAEVLPDAG